MKKTFKTLIFTTVLAAISGSVFADLQLHEGSDSADIEVQAQIPEMVTITTPTAMPEMTFDGKNEMTATSSFCIASNLESDKVQLTVSNNHAGAGFALVKDGGTPADNKTLPFSVSYKSANGADTAITKGQKIEVNGAKWLADCKSAPQTGSSITVKINETDSQHVYAGNYNAVMTLTITTK